MRLRAATLVVLGLLSASAGLSQSPAPPNRTAPSEPASESDARRALEEFAACTVRSKKVIAAKALVEDWSVPMMIKQDLISPDCVEAGTLTALPAIMKGALAEQLIRQDNIEAAPAQLTSIPSLAMRAADLGFASNGLRPASTPKLDVEKELEAYRRYVGMAQFGECVVRTDPLNSRALLATKIVGKEEFAAAQRLAPALSSCVPAGQTVGFSPAMVRNAVALSYYRMAMATRGVGWRAEGASK